MQDIKMIEIAKEEQPSLSIVTVVFNGVNVIEKTIQSVINQSYSNIEYIIIDGGSTDGTVSIIEKYTDQINYWVSEKDDGIYDAMNKGVGQVHGHWINFMNAGDYFFSKNILEEMFENGDFHDVDVDVVYGNTQVRYPKRKKIAKAGNICNLDKGSQFCHQSVFIDSALQKKLKYNVFNRIGADFEFFYSAYMNDSKFKFSNRIISSVSSGGLSDINRVESIVSWWNVVNKHGMLNLYYLAIILKEIIKEKIKNLVK